MTTKEIRNALLFALVLIAFGVAMRLLPHTPNITPITALGLVAGAYLGRHFAYTVPLAALFLSDLTIGFYDWRIMASVYGSFAVVGLIGFLARRYRSVLNYAALSIVGSAFFFLSTNAAVWLLSPWYEKSLAGLLYSFQLGLPFWRNMLVGDVLYTTLLVATAEATIFACSRLRRRVLV